ncbi:hypothetical protein [Clostridium sp. YIM B02555]|uniref:hypothetical protein n=1 Tax=Clostridium sp. YIM B02555 TaxID=2911968 RepID=UPI001EEEB164|nr:hypothetical protein [Clostridium sp. YIM B02555]
MILVNCAWKQEDIIKHVENIVVDNEKAFKLVKVEGIRILFDTQVEDMKSIKLIKAAIKNIKGYQALAVDVVPVVNNSMFEGYTKLL